MAEKQIKFPPWYGEFGWEVMTWAPMCRKAAQDHDEVIVTSFADMAPLYADFATEFYPNGRTCRSLDYPKHYHVKGLHRRYGDPNQAIASYDVLIHARGIGRKSSINYKHWQELCRALVDESRMALSAAWIGSPEDIALPGWWQDLRGIALQELMDTIAASKVVIGCSSGIMHLAAACGTNLVVWGDTKTRYWETLEKRYKETWNPQHVQVGWIDADDWQPQPERIIKSIEVMLSQTSPTGPTGQTNSKGT